MAERFDLAESLHFNPGWHWDPVPPFLREYLTVEIARDLARIQLEKRLRINEIEQTAIKETIKVIGGIQGR